MRCSTLTLILLAASGPAAAQTSAAQAEAWKREAQEILGVPAQAPSPPRPTSQDPQVSALMRRAMNNFAHEHAVCAAYFVVANKCFGSTDRAIAEKVQSVGAEMIKRGRDWTATAGLKPETFSARIEMAISQMTKTLDNDCSNISLVLRDHAESCKFLAEQPEKRIEQIIERTPVR